MREGIWHGLTMMPQVLYLLVCLPLAEGWGEPIPFEDGPPLPAAVVPLAGCWSLPVQETASVVSLYVAKAQDNPGIVCARVINGISPSIGIGADAFRLQRWEDGKFRDFPPPSPPMTSGVVAAGLVVPAGQILDRRLPLSGEPVPPGRYRACFKYALKASGEEREVCSEELSLP